MSDSHEPLLEGRDLKKHDPITQGVLRKEIGRVRAVDGISFEVEPGETVGLVGESGCGKSTAATTMIRLEDATDGSVFFRGEDIHAYDRKQLKRFRRSAQMIFQDPNSSFDPRMSIGESVAEPLVIHGFTDRKRRRGIVKNLLERVGLSGDDIDRYPHEFSGGQKQRIALARALVVNPDLIIADEPVSALDVSIQAEILSLINDIQDEFGIGIVFISHNLGVIRQVCDRVNVMYLGEIVESGPTEELFENPQHPYTQALLGSIPSPDPRRRGQGIQLTGDVPSPSNPPSGCRFHTRCPKVIQPEGYDFEQPEWRSVMDLRERIRTREVDLDAAREFVATERGIDAEEVSDEAMEATIRDEFDIPDRLSDEAGEEVLSEAFDHLIGGDIEAADDLLASEFETICERESPTLSETDAGHPAACHLHDERVAADLHKSAALDD